MNCDPDTIRCQIERIADTVTGFDLNSFLTTLLATLIGAGVAAAVSFWLADRERPKPLWRVRTGEMSKEPRDGKGAARVTLTNIGDGAAYNVRLSVVDGLRRTEESSVLVPGEVLSTWVDFPMTGELEYDVDTDGYTDSRVATWGRPVALIEWQQPPRRRRVRRQRESLKNPKG